MTSLNYAQFMQEATRMYAAGEYAQTQALVEAHPEFLADHGYILYNFKLCMAALLCQTEAALESFRTALDQGVWWSEEVLRNDPDLASLQGHPEFERLMEVCNHLGRQARVAARPERMIAVPASTDPGPYPLLMALHGRGSNGCEALETWQFLADKGWLVVALQSSQMMGAGAYGWDALDRTLSEISDHLQSIQHSFPVDRRRIILGGFSQGGGLVARLALTQFIPARGFVSVAPWMPANEPPFQPALELKLSGVRGYLVTGGRDHIQDGIERVTRLVEASGVPLQVDHYPEVGHEFPPDFPQTAARALSFLEG